MVRSFRRARRSLPRSIVTLARSPIQRLSRPAPEGRGAGALGGVSRRLIDLREPGSGPDQGRQLPLPTHLKLPVLQQPLLH